MSIRLLNYIWVAVQVVLIGIIIQAPPDTLALPEAVRVLGLILLGIGLLIVAISALNLGSSLTIFPTPKPDGQLVTTGLYAWVRHPIYTGVLATALGWTVARGSLIGLLTCIALFVFFDRKAAYEDRHLADRFPGFAAYRTRVRKLIPWIY